MYNLAAFKPILSEDLIRIGRNEDGGYVLNKRVLERTQVLISFGIHTDWSFEAHFFKLKNGRDIKLEAYDYSVNFIYFIRTAWVYLFKIFSGLKNIKYALYFVKLAFRFALFFNKKNIRFYKKGIDDKAHDPFITFEIIFKQLDLDILDNSVFVKMDIEGYEYKVLKEMLDYSNKIVGFVVEFHDLEDNGLKLEELVQLAKDKEYVITHAHPNNWGGLIQNTNLPRLVEITFSKKVLFAEDELSVVNSLKYPRPGLDYPSVKSKPELTMPFTEL